MPEEIEEQTGTTEIATAPEASSYSEILEGQATEPTNPDAGVKPEDGITEQGEKPPASQEDPEVILEIGGKSFTMKQSEAVQVLENHTKLSDREKALDAKEASINKFHTQKGQKNAGFRKSIETAFGRFPEQAELQALGKIWKAYFSNEQARQTIDSILSGRSVAGTKTQGDVSERESQLEAKIYELEEKLGQFTNSITEREESEKVATAQKSWQSWVDTKSKDGIKVTDEIDAAMAPFISAFKTAHPDWDNNRILDEAYKHATINDMEKNVAGKVLQSADKAKKVTLPKITPKQPAKSDKDMSYRDIFMSAVQ